MNGFYGGEKQTKETIEGLIAKGHNVYLLTLKNSELSQKINCKTFYFDIYPYPDTRLKTLLFFIKVPFYRLKFYFLLKNIIRQNPIDVVCMQEPYEKIVFSSLFKKFNVKIVWLEILYWEPFLSANRLLFSTMLGASKCCDKIIASSNFMQRQISKYINQNKIELIKHSLTREDQQSLILIHRKRNYPIAKIGFAGSLSKLKGVYMLLDAFTSLIDDYPQLTLCFAGDGKEKDGLKVEIEQNNLSNKVFLLGKYPIIDFFKQIDILITPSLYDNLPYVLQEAICAKLPVITTNQGGMPEYFQDTLVKKYCLSKPNSAEDLKDKIIQIINLSGPELKKISKINYDYYQKNFIFKDMLEKVEILFATIVNGHVNTKNQ